MTMSADENGSKSSTTTTTATPNNNNNNNNNNNSKHHTHHSRMLQHTIKTENNEHFSAQQHIDSGKWHGGPNGLPPPPLHPPSSLHNGRWDDGPPVYSALVKVCSHQCFSTFFDSRHPWPAMLVFGGTPIS